MTFCISYGQQVLKMFHIHSKYTCIYTNTPLTSRLQVLPVPNCRAMTSRRDGCWRGLQDEYDKKEEL